jgi:hypothetical protein
VQADLCASLVGDLAMGRANMTSFIQKALVDRRLGDGRLTGKISRRNAAINGLQAYVQVRLGQARPPGHSLPGPGRCGGRAPWWALHALGASKGPAKPEAARPAAWQLAASSCQLKAP